MFSCPAKVSWKRWDQNFRYLGVGKEKWSLASSASKESVPGWCCLTDTGIRKHQRHTKQSLWISMICEWIWVNVTTKLIPSFFLRISPTFSTLLALGLTLLIPPGTLAAYGSSWCWVLESTECLSWTFLDFLSPDFGRVWQMSLQWLLCLRKALFIVRPNQKKIAEMAAMKQSCTVLRDNKWKERAWRHGMSPNLRRKTEVTA